MAQFNKRPIAGKVVVEPIAAEEKTASGIIIPDTAKEKPQQGTVVAVGADTKDVKMELKPGDVVFYGKYAGTEITIDDKDYLIVNHADILLF